MLPSQQRYSQVSGPGLVGVCCVGGASLTPGYVTATDYRAGYLADPDSDADNYMRSRTRASSTQLRLLETNRTFCTGCCSKSSKLNTRHALETMIIEKFLMRTVSRALLL